MYSVWNIKFCHHLSYPHIMIISFLVIDCLNLTRFNYFEIFPTKHKTSFVVTVLIPMLLSMLIWTKFNFLSIFSPNPGKVMNMDPMQIFSLPRSSAEEMLHREQMGRRQFRGKGKKGGKICDVTFGLKWFRLTINGTNLGLFKT